MRLQLRPGCLVAPAALCAAVALAGGQAATRVDVYSDEWIQVVIPTVRGAWEGEAWTLDGAYGVNAISGATQVLTADAITSATTWSETRHQVDASVRAHPVETWSVGTFVLTSHEPDYRTWAGGLTGALDLFDRMSTATATLGHSREVLGSSADRTVREHTAGTQLDLGWTQILTEQTVARLLLTGSLTACGDRFGCLASPYRFVAVTGPDGLTVTLPERNPDTLWRGAAALQLSQALGGATALHGAYRFYADTWRISGHTVEVGLARSLLDDRLTLRADGRIADQGAARFYRDTYATSEPLVVPGFRSSDRELSGMSNRTVGGRARWTFENVGPTLSTGLSLRVARTWYRYPDHSELDARASWLVGGGLDAEF